MGNAGAYYDPFDVPNSETILLEKKKPKNALFEKTTTKTLFPLLSTIPKGSIKQYKKRIKEHTTTTAKQKRGGVKRQQATTPKPTNNEEHVHLVEQEASRQNTVSMNYRRDSITPQEALKAFARERHIQLDQLPRTANVKQPVLMKQQKTGVKGSIVSPEKQVKKKKKKKKKKRFVIRPTGLLRVIIRKATNLKGHDPMYKVDAQVILKNGEVEVGRTRRVPNTHDPEWNETFEFRMNRHEKLEINVFDTDFVTGHHKIGMCGAVPLETLKCGVTKKLKLPVVYVRDHLNNKESILHVHLTALNFGKHTPAYLPKHFPIVSDEQDTMIMEGEHIDDSEDEEPVNEDDHENEEPLNESDHENEELLKENDHENEEPVKEDEEPVKEENEHHLLEQTNEKEKEEDLLLTEDDLDHFLEDEEAEIQFSDEEDQLEAISQLSDVTPINEANPLTSYHQRDDTPVSDMFDDVPTRIHSAYKNTFLDESSDEPIVERDFEAEENPIKVDEQYVESETGDSSAPTSPHSRPPTSPIGGTRSFQRPPSRVLTPISPMSDMSDDEQPPQRRPKKTKKKIAKKRHSTPASLSSLCKKYGIDERNTTIARQIALIQQRAAQKQKVPSTRPSFMPVNASVAPKAIARNHADASEHVYLNQFVEYDHFEKEERRRRRAAKDAEILAEHRLQKHQDTTPYMNTPLKTHDDGRVMTSRELTQQPTTPPRNLPHKRMKAYSQKVRRYNRRHSNYSLQVPLPYGSNTAALDNYMIKNDEFI